MGMYVSPYVENKGAYGADQTEKVGAFRAERTVKVVPLKLIELGKMGAFKNAKFVQPASWVILVLNLYQNISMQHCRSCLYVLSDSSNVT